LDSSERSDEDEADDVEQLSNSEQEDADRQLNADNSATDCEQQTASAKQTRSQATQDALQEKIKDMINVAHVSKLCSLEVSEEVWPHSEEYGIITLKTHLFRQQTIEAIQKLHIVWHAFVT